MQMIVSLLVFKVFNLSLIPGNPKKKFNVYNGEVLFFYFIYLKNIKQIWPNDFFSKIKP